MSVADLKANVPGFSLPVIGALLVLTFLYSVLISGQLLLWFVLWGGIVSVAAMVAIVYLLYRLVLAVERIADSQ